MSDSDRVRLDRWLWAARFFKTRSLAKAAIEGGKVDIGGQKPKVSKELTIGEELKIRRGEVEQTIIVTGLAERRGSAAVAQTLYQETTASINQREGLRAQRRMERAGLKIPATKPTKQGRRALQRLKQQSPTDD